MSDSVHAILIGVSHPRSVRWSDAVGRFVAADLPRRPDDLVFEPLFGVSNDLDAYEHIVNEATEQTASITRLESPVDTTLARVTSELQAHTTSCDCSTLVVVMVGHGFQLPTGDPRESDGLDELFALSDGPLIDDHWGTLWRNARSDMSAVVIVDSCHSDSIARGLLVPEPCVRFEKLTSGPPRIFISASLDEQKAKELSFGKGVQGVLSRELQLAWSSPGNRTSYAAWFDYAARGVNRTMLQTAVMTIVDADSSIQLEKPF